MPVDVECIRSPKGPSDLTSLLLKLLCILVKAFLPLELRPLHKENIRSCGQEAKILLADTRDNSELYHSNFSSLIPRIIGPGYGRNSNICWMLIYSIYSFLENTARPFTALPPNLAVTVTKSPKHCSIKPAAPGRLVTWWIPWARAHKHISLAVK